VKMEKCAVLGNHDYESGQSEEVKSILGATRLSGPIDQLRPNMAIHGHAHRGTLRGTTRGGVPVVNVALPVLRRLEKPLGYLTLDVQQHPVFVHPAIRARSSDTDT